MQNPLKNQTLFSFFLGDTDQRPKPTQNYILNKPSLISYNVLEQKKYNPNMTEIYFNPIARANPKQLFEHWTPQAKNNENLTLF